MSTPETFNRRVDDLRIQKLVDDIAVVNRTHARTRNMETDILRLTGEQIRMGKALDEISKTTTQVRDILVTFRVTNAVAKWVSTIVGSIVVVVGAVYYFFAHIK